MQTGHPFAFKETQLAVQSFVKTGQPFKFCDAPALDWPGDSGPDDADEDDEELLLPEMTSLKYVQYIFVQNHAFVLFMHPICFKVLTFAKRWLQYVRTMGVGTGAAGAAFTAPIISSQLIYTMTV